jgi:hypothetical protein
MRLVDKDEFVFRVAKRGNLESPEAEEAVDELLRDIGADPDDISALGKIREVPNSDLSEVRGQELLEAAESVRKKSIVLQTAQDELLSRLDDHAQTLKKIAKS